VFRSLAIICAERQATYSPEVRNDPFPIPSRPFTPQLGPPIILAPRPSYRHHAVDGGAAADATSRPDELIAVMHVRLRHRGDVVANAGVIEGAPASFANDLVGH